jgi:transcriptional regulator with XRE-family HTH domain
MAKNFRELYAKMDPPRRAQVEERVQQALRAMPLEELRGARELTQTQLAQVLQISQGAVSKVERRADMYISTLRSYIRAIGGDLQIRAVFPEGEVLINQFEDIDPLRKGSAAEKLAEAGS